MSSGLYVPAHDVIHPTPGAGVSTWGRLCSTCGLPSKSKGGALFDGRWYCAKCKPRASAKDLAKWAKAVHTQMLATGAAMTPAEAIRLFGNPPTRSSAAATLDAALRRGWFTRDTESRYTAIAPAPPKPRQAKADVGESYFTGLVRVRSVFDLGSTT